MRYLCAACLLFLLPAANAAGSAELMEYRSRVMEGAQRHLRAASSIVNDGVELPAHLAEHARALQAFSRMIPEMFPPAATVPAAMPKRRSGSAGTNSPPWRNGWGRTRKCWKRRRWMANAANRPMRTCWKPAAPVIGSFASAEVVPGQERTRE